MVGEVNKLIYNALIKYHAIYIPDVGTISVVRHSAAMGSKNELIPPHFDIEYSSHNRAKSLINILSENTGVDTKRAEEIYSRWLDKSREGSVVVIDRVGTLRDKSFEADKALIKALNICCEPLRVTRRRSNALLYVAIAIVAVCAICGGGWWYLNNQQIDTATEIVAETITEVEVAPKQELPSVVESQESENKQIEDAATADDWRIRDDIRHWVVVGSYSTTENAERAIADIVKHMPDMQCDYFKLGSMYAVAVFGSADIDECQVFKKAHAKEFAQSWVYTPKKFR